MFGKWFVFASLVTSWPAGGRLGGGIGGRMCGWARPSDRHARGGGDFNESNPRESRPDFPPCLRASVLILSRALRPLRVLRVYSPGDKLTFRVTVSPGRTRTVDV
jgi:hypothetical protein